MSATVDVLVICALEDELERLREVSDGLLERWTPVAGDVEAWTAVFEGSSAPVRIIAARPHELEDEDDTTALAAALVGQLDVSVMAISGVCAGHPDDVDFAEVALADPELDALVQFVGRLPLRVKLLVCRHESHASRIAALASLSRKSGDIRTAVALYERALAFEELLDQRERQAELLGELGLCYASLGELDQAIEHHQRALVINQSLEHLEAKPPTSAISESATQLWASHTRRCRTSSARSRSQSSWATSRCRPTSSAISASRSRRSARSPRRRGG